MTPTPHKRIQRTIAAHFVSGSSPGAEQDMRAHLRSCADCRDLYQRHLIIARFDPRGVPAEERLARGLGFRTPPRRRPPVWFGLGAAAGAAVAAAVILVAGIPRGHEQDQPDHDGSLTGFAARGLPAAAGAPDIEVYRLPSKDARPAPAGSLISSRDELAFAYRNSGAAGATPKKWLLIFAVDEHGHVYWYHPGWSDAGEDPTALKISTAPGLHELPSAVAHKFDGEKVVIHALFTARSMTVRQVEAAVQATIASDDVVPAGGDRSEALLAIPDAVDVRRPFRVVR